MSPLRIKFLSHSVKRRRVLDKLAIFEANAALTNEKSLNSLNHELMEVQS